MNHQNKKLLIEFINCKRTKNIGFYLLLIILLISILLAWSFYYSNQLTIANSKTNNFALLNPARKLFAQRDMIVNIQPLRDELTVIGKDPNVSVYFEFLNTGANIYVNKDQSFFPANLIKLPGVMAIIKKIESGRASWTDELVLIIDDKDAQSGDLYKQPVGTKFTIEDLVKATLINSDSTAYHLLLRDLDSSELDSIHNHLGIDVLFSTDGKVSAKNYSILLRSLYNASYLSEADSNLVLSIMADTKSSEYLKQGLSKDIKFSNKIGVSSDEKIFLDSGIAYLPSRPYLLTVMISGKSEEEATALMKNISEKTYSYISTYSETN